MNLPPLEELEPFEKQYLERTQEHIRLVNYFASKIGRSYPNHDASKLDKDQLFYPYSLFSKENKTKQEEEALDLATLLHITNNPHHPEYWTDTDLTGFTRKNFTPNGIIDATQMEDESILELCVDWCACSKEFGNTPFEWFNKVNGTRWLFTPEQQKLIQETLKIAWGEEDEE